MQNAGDEYACLPLCIVLCVLARVYSVCRLGCVCTRVFVYLCVYRGVCKGVSVCDDGEAGLLSFNTVLLGHWAICKCTELTAEAQSSHVHPPTSSTPPFPSVPPTVWLSRLTDSSRCSMKQRHKRKYGPGCLWRSRVSIVIFAGVQLGATHKRAESFHVDVTFITHQSKLVIRD